MKAGAGKSAWPHGDRLFLEVATHLAQVRREVPVGALGPLADDGDYLVPAGGLDQPVVHPSPPQLGQPPRQPQPARHGTSPLKPTHSID